jgi:geranylgeranyl diphosphate synthase type II
MQGWEGLLPAITWPEMGSWEKWMHYALEGGGKRLRPRLVWEVYALYAKGDPDLVEALPAMRAIELVHTFTLVHDDVMDRSELRRGRPTIHTLTDENTAILIGDALIIAAYEVLSDLRPEVRAKVLRHLSRQALRVCHGQLLDLALAQRPTAAVKLEEYLQMIREKTGALMGAAMAIGGLLAQQEDPLITALQEAGEKLGIFFQVQDDYLDAYSTQTGKPLGGDIVEGKRTFLWLWAYEEVSPAVRALMEDPTKGEERRAILLEYYHKPAFAQKARAFWEAQFQEVERTFLTLPQGEKVWGTLRELYGRQR